MRLLDADQEMVVRPWGRCKIVYELPTFVYTHRAWAVLALCHNKQQSYERNDFCNLRTGGIRAAGPHSRLA
jgi:hypothetical protein